jgi:hypothetical protein
MQTAKQYKTVNGKTAKQSAFKWRIAAICIPVVVVALMLMSISLSGDKVAPSHYHTNNAYRAGDMVLKLAMPVLDAALK